MKALLNVLMTILYMLDNMMENSNSLCLYVDDLLYTGNDVGLLEKFKVSMK